jgi:phosphoribosylglycinamide formyltransferase-1
LSTVSIILHSKKPKSATRVTVHLVEEKYDSGPVLAQIRVSVMPEDTVQTLQERVLRHEHALYPEVLRRIVNGEIIIPGYTKE